jgi:hypothetical protein
VRKITAILAFLALSVYGVNTYAQVAPAPKPAAMPAPVMAVMAVKAPQPAAKALAAMPAPAMPAAPAMAPAATMKPAMITKPMVAKAPTAMAAQPVVSAAPAGKKDSVKKVVIGGLLEILLYVVGTLFSALIPVLLALFYKKAKIESTAAKDAIDTVVDKAVTIGMNYAEEKARGMSDNPEKSAVKKKQAIAAANKYLRDSKMAEKGAEYLGMLIEAKLGASRNGESKPAPKPADSSIPEGASQR